MKHDKTSIAQIAGDSDETLDGSQFRVTIQMCAKHADLLEATRKRGSVRKLADRLGIFESELSDWIRLKRKPSFDNPAKSKRWSKTGEKERLAKIMFEETGKTLEELWPDAVFTQDFLDLPKTTEVQSGVDCRGLAMHQAELLSLPSPVEVASDGELNLAIQESLNRLPGQYRDVVIRHLGLGVAKKESLRKIGKRYSLSAERIRQIFVGAIERLKHMNVKLHGPLSSWNETGDAIDDADEDSQSLTDDPERKPNDDDEEN